MGYGILCLPQASREALLMIAGGATPLNSTQGCVPDKAISLEIVVCHKCLLGILEKISSGIGFFGKERYSDVMSSWV